MDWEAYEEAERRGLLTPGQTEALAEARRRGLTGAADQPSRPEAAARGALNWWGGNNDAYQAALEGVSKLDPEYARKVAAGYKSSGGVVDALSALGIQPNRPNIQSDGMSPAQLAQAQTDTVLRKPEQRAAAAHPVSSFAGAAVPAAIAGGAASFWRTAMATEAAAARQSLPLLERMLANAKSAVPLSTYFGGVTGAGMAGGGPVERAQGAALGAGVGAVVGPVAGAVIPEAINGVANVARFGAGLVNRFGMTPEQRAAAMIQRRIGPQGLRPTDGPEQIIDVGGKRVAGLAEAVHAVDETPGSEIVARARAGQKGDVQDWMLGKNAQATGKDQAGYHVTLEGLAEKRRVDAAPLYQRAHQTPIGPEDWDSIDPFLTRIPKDVHRGAQELADLEGQKPTPFQYLDYVRRELEDRIQTTAPLDPRTGRPVPTSQGRALGQIKGQIDDFLNAVSDERSGGAWSQAKQAYSGPSRQMDAMRLGREIVARQKLDPEDIVARAGAMSENDKDALVFGLSRGIGDITEKGKVLSFSRALQNDRRLQQRLVAVLGQDRFDELARSTARAGNILENTNRITGNSATAGRQENIRNATDGENEMPQLAQDLLGGRRLSAVPAYLGRVVARNSTPGIRNPKISEAVAKRLTQQATPENVRALLDEMAMVDRLRGARQAPVQIPYRTGMFGAPAAAPTSRQVTMFGGKP